MAVAAEVSVSLVSYAHGTTVGDLVSETEGHLYGLQRAALNDLNGSVTTAATTLTVTDSLDGIRAGAYIEVDDEEMYVRSTAGQVATVRRGMNGTTAASHDDGSLVRVEPRFSRSRILAALRGDIESWPGTVYARYVGQLSVGSHTRSLDVAGLAGIEGAQLIAAQRSPLAAYEQTWATIPGARLSRRQATSDFPSGYALEFPNFGGNQSATYWGWDDWGTIVNVSAFTALVRVKARFNTSIFSSGTDVGQVMGMPLALANIAPYGAAARLLVTRDIARTDPSAKGRSRPSEEVRVGDATSTARSLLAFRDLQLAEAAKTIFLAEEGWALYT
jgi:hypothetical protein